MNLTKDLESKAILLISIADAVNRIHQTICEENLNGDMNQLDEDLRWSLVHGLLDLKQYFREYFPE